MPRCSACSLDVTAGSRFCPGCGTALPAADLTGPYRPAPGLTPTETAAPPTPSSGSGARFAAGALLAGRYRIVAPLGKGGMGEVYRADDLKLGQPVALKFLPEEVAADPGRLARFHQEVRIARQVSHPNVCRVHDIGEADGQHFLTMEYIDGEDLAALLRRIGRLPPDKGVELARQLCLGLAAAHEQGVLHRDLKPQNVMIDGRGQVRLTDFGIAGFAEHIHGAEVLAGTPAYQAPEQRAGREVSVQSDLFSLGLVLREMFTGQPTGATPARPSGPVTGLDPAVERTILRCLAPEPRDRPRSALAVAAGLPGGDPLAAALAAGETPSPEVVANADVDGTLSPRVAVALLAFVLAGIAAVALLADRTRLFRLVPLEKSPQELAFKARALIEQLGCDAPAVGRDGKFYVNGSILNYLGEHDPSPTRLERLAGGQPDAIFFCYRQGPRPLSAARADSMGRVQPHDPPPTLPGMVTVYLDPKGRLIQLLYVPSEEEPDGESPGEPSWGSLFTAAGLDLREFRAVPPRWVPPVFGEQRAAWDGTYPDQPDLPLHVEAAAHRGGVVWFQMIGPWDKPLTTHPPPAGRPIARYAWLAMTLLVFVAGGLLAWRNWRAGRADTRGARRLALYSFAVLLLQWIITADHTSSPGLELSLFVAMLGPTLFSVAPLWVAYLALEPYVRRRWPWQITSWKRALEGRFRDPLLARDVLLGCALGVTMELLIHVDQLAPRWLGLPPPTRSLLYFPDMNDAFATVIGTQYSAVVQSLTWFLVLFLLVLLCRRRWLACLVVWVLAVAYHAFIGTGIDYPYLRAVTGGLFVLFAVVLAVRVGILCLAVGMYVTWVLQWSMIAADLSTWYAHFTLVPVVVLAGLAVYGGVVSLGGQPLFRELLREEA